MRWIVFGIGILVVLTGGVFFLQGINILPGSFMTGDPKWAVIGLMMIVFGGLACYYTSRRKPSSPQA